MSSSQVGRYSGKPTGGRPAALLGTNGRLSLSQLLRCETQPQLRGSSAQYLYAPYARSFDAMTRAAAESGRKLILVAGYRDYAEQVHQKAVWTARGKPGNAATPGHSTHGLGVTVDIDRYQPGILDWLKAHAPGFGFDHPLWAGSAKGPQFGREPWHWQGLDGWQGAADEIPVYVHGARLPEAHAYQENNLIYAALRPVATALQAQIDGFRDGAAHVDGPGEGKAGWVPMQVRAEGGFSPVRTLGNVLGVPVFWTDGEVRIG